MAYIKANGKNINGGGGGGSNLPLYNESVLLYSSFSGNTIRAFGLETYTDLGVFFTAPSQIIRIKENFLDNSITVLCASSPYVHILDLQGNVKYVINQPNSRVNDCVIYKDYLYTTGQMTSNQRMIDLKNGSYVDTSNQPTLTGVGYACSVAPNGYLAVLGDYANRFKVIDLNSMTEITGYPSIAEVPIIDVTSDTSMLPQLFYNDNNEWVVAFRDSAYFNRTKMIGLSNKTLNASSSSGGVVSSENCTLFVNDGKKIYYGSNSASSNQIIYINSVSGTVNYYTVPTIADRPAMIFADALQINKFIAVNTTLYRYAYAGTTLLGTHTLGQSVGTRQARLCVTNIFKINS